MKRDMVNAKIIMEDYHVSKSMSYKLVADFRNEYEGTDKCIHAGRMTLCDRKTFEDFWERRGRGEWAPRKIAKKERTEMIRKEYERLYKLMDWGQAPRKIDIFSMLEDVQLRMDLLQRKDKSLWWKKHSLMAGFISRANAEITRCVRHSETAYGGHAEKFEIDGEEVDWEW